MELRRRKCLSMPLLALISLPTAQAKPHPAGPGAGNASCALTPCVLTLPHSPALPQGYSNARWVDGELLVFADGSPFVQGAQLGFTYDVGTHQR